MLALLNMATSLLEEMMRHVTKMDSTIRHTCDLHQIATEVGAPALALLQAGIDVAIQLHLAFATAQSMANTAMIATAAAVAVTAGAMLVGRELHIAKEVLIDIVGPQARFHLLAPSGYSTTILSVKG